MKRYKKSYKLDGWPILDESRDVVIEKDEIARLLNEYDALIKEAVDYLATNNLTSIGHGSILHQKFINLASA